MISDTGEFVSLVTYHLSLRKTPILQKRATLNGGFANIHNGKAPVSNFTQQ